MNYVLHQQG